MHAPLFWSLFLRNYFWGVTPRHWEIGCRNFEVSLCLRQFKFCSVTPATVSLSIVVLQKWIPNKFIKLCSSEDNWIGNWLKRWRRNYHHCWIKRDQHDVTCFIISLFNAQHVSDVNTSETCWALNNEIIKQVTSSWPLFIQISNIHIEPER